MFRRCFRSKLHIFRIEMLARCTTLSVYSPYTCDFRLKKTLHKPNLNTPQTERLNTQKILLNTVKSPYPQEKKMNIRTLSPIINDFLCEILFHFFISAIILTFIKYVSDSNLAIGIIKSLITNGDVIYILCLIFPALYILEKITSHQKIRCLVEFSLKKNLSLYAQMIGLATGFLIFSPSWQNFFFVALLLLTSITFFLLYKNNEKIKKSINKPVWYSALLIFIAIAPLNLLVKPEAIYCIKILAPIFLQALIAIAFLIIIKRNNNKVQEYFPTLFIQLICIIAWIAFACYKLYS